ncbi:hypothetical protein, partial [Chryseobacterium sp.]|uniref:hypothetical protein n=1 Tax=Chryseobacterium sp. TaxID=1871047 RepID=UPI0024E1C0DF
FFDLCWSVLPHLLLSFESTSSEEENFFLRKQGLGYKKCTAFERERYSYYSFPTFSILRASV